MVSRNEVLENHAVVVRDGRILDVLPSVAAATKYSATVHFNRSEHVLMPGLVNAQTPIASEQTHDGALLRVAQMLRTGTTCFCGTGFFPEESLRAALEQGMRALIGIPIAELASSWAETPDEYLRRALDVRDEFRGHPTIATAFAPHNTSAISDGLFGRIATLANELDAAILMTLHQSPSEIDESVVRHGLRPIERMHALGLLTPALTAVHMVHVDEADFALAQRSGVAITLCPESNLRLGHGPPPVAAWAGSGLRLALGSGTQSTGAGLDLWSQLKLLALLSLTPESGGVGLTAWDALSVATRGGAAALGLDAEIGTLEPGKWADLCCVQLGSPAMLPADAAHAATLLAFDGSRDMVSDVWVSGRHLLAGGVFTRLDWPALAARTGEST